MWCCSMHEQPKRHAGISVLHAFRGLPGCCLRGLVLRLSTAGLWMSLGVLHCASPAVLIAINPLCCLTCIVDSLVWCM